MLYLLDTSLLVQAKDEFYPMQRFWQVWDWLEAKALVGQIKIPREIFNELLDYEDELAEWSKIRATILTIDEEITHLDQIYRTGYGFTSEPSEAQKLIMGMDPFLMNYCINDIQNRSVVSNETSKPSRKEQNRKIPDVCNDLGIRHLTMPLLLHELDFYEK